jgi:hypothetical protein
VAHIVCALYPGPQVTGPDRRIESASRVQDDHLTPKGALAVVGEGRNSYNDLLAVYDSYAELASDLAPYGEAMGIKRWPYAMVTQIADALGEQPPVEDLDI